jgi:hypothetical protein
MTVIIYNYRANKVNKENKPTVKPKSVNRTPKPKTPKKKETSSIIRTIKRPSDKPVFHTYGRKNTTPVYGGVSYGDYMLTHNVNPEYGQNKPKYQQVYNSGANKGFTKVDRVELRRDDGTVNITKKNLKVMMDSQPIMPKKFKNPEAEDKYSEVPESKYDFTHLKKKNKNNVEFHPAEHEDEDEDDEDEEEEPEAEEMHHIALSEEGAQAYPEDRNHQISTPEPGSLEYKRMLEQFLNNPEYIKTLMQEGGDLQNMFPFCSVHNSYGQQLPTHELDPKNYKFLPSKYTQRIAPAGRQTSKSDNMYKLILPE